MALSDKNIVITPNISQSADPQIVFSGADASTGPQNITLRVYPTNNGTLSFEGSAGQLFSVNNSTTGTIFSANDVSGIPSIEVIDTGLVKLAQYGGNVLLGTGADNATDKLQVNGNIIGTIIKASTFVSSVGTGTAPFTVSSSTQVNNLNAQYWNGNSFSTYLNQAVRTDSSPTFGQVYNNGWFRNNTNNTGLYNENTTQHLSSNTNGWWDASGGSGSTFSGIRFYTGGHMSSHRGSVYANTSNEIGFLNSSGSWILRVDSGGTTYGTFSGNITGNVTGNVSGSSGSCTGNAATATSADQIDSIGFRNTNQSAINADTLESNGITYYTAGVTNFSGNSTDGALYSHFYSSSWQHQIAGDFRSGQIAVRGKNSGTWQSWKIIATNARVFAQNLILS